MNISHLTDFVVRLVKCNWHIVVLFADLARRVLQP